MRLKQNNFMTSKAWSACFVASLRDNELDDLLLAKQIWLRIDCCERQTQFGVVPLGGSGFSKVTPLRRPVVREHFLDQWVENQIFLT